MSVFRVEKNSNYTVMSNHHLRNTDLSLRAKGLLSQILSLPEGWDYTIAGLAKINKEGKDAVRAAVQELEKAGYIERRQTNSGGKFGGNEYVVYESPRAAAPLSDFPTTENPLTGNPLTENPTQLNKEELSKDNNPPISPPEGAPPADPPKRKKRSRDSKETAEVLPERFEKFWKFYRDNVPTGVSAGNRQKAIRAWDKLSPDTALVDALAAALCKQVKSQVWKSGVGVPHASTWLNNRGWEDDWGAPAGAVRPQPDNLPTEEDAEWVS